MKTVTKEFARNLSPLNLAFLGDSVYDALLRRKLTVDLPDGGVPVRQLHSRASDKARASYQSKAITLIEAELTCEEADILRRGRNANPRVVTKSASPEDYRRATGLEALFGYLSLIGEDERIEKLFEIIFTGEAEI